VALTIRKLSRPAADLPEEPEEQDYGVNARASDLARVSMQLSRLPFHALDPRNDDQAELGIEYEYGAQTVTWGVSGDWDPDTKTRRPDALGPLPGPHARSVLVALGRAWNGTRDIKKRNMELSRNRRFTLPIRDLFAVMGVAKSGRAYEMLRETLKRMRSLTITTKGGWREDGKWVDEELIFGLVDEARIVGRQDSLDGGKVVITLGERVAKSLAQHSRLLDAKVYERLSNSTAKTLYMLLDAERHSVDNRGETELRCPLAWLKDRLAMSASTTKEIKKILDRAHAELVQEGYLAPVEYVEARPEDYRRFASRLGSKSKPVAALYRILAPQTPERKEDEARARAETAVRAAQIGLALPPADTLQTRLERVCRVTRQPNFRPYKRVTELLEWDEFDTICRRLEIDGDGWSSKALAGSYQNQAKVALRRRGVAV